MTTPLTLDPAKVAAAQASHAAVLAMFDAIRAEQRAAAHLRATVGG